MGDFEDHKVLLARRSGLDTLRDKPKQAEGPKGHLRHDDPERDTPVKTATYHALNEAGWSTDRDLSRPGQYVAVRLFNNQGSPLQQRRTGQVIPNVTTIDEVPDMREETTRNRKGSAMIVLVHDRATDYNGISKDPDYGHGEWYRIKDILDNAWGGKSREQGDVKAY